MRLIVAGIVCVLIAGGAGVAKAESNPDLVALLNNILDLETASLRQVTAHSNQYPAAAVYFTILSDKEKVVSQLQDTILGMKGKPALPQVIAELYPTVLESVSNDAHREIAIIRACEELLEKFGHPQARQAVQKAKDAASRHYMALTNYALEILINEHLHP